MMLKDLVLKDLVFVHILEDNKDFKKQKTH